MITNTYVRNIIGRDVQFDFKGAIHPLATYNLLFLLFSNIYSIYENMDFSVLSSLL